MKESNKFIGNKDILLAGIILSFAFIIGLFIPLFGYFISVLLLLLWKYAKYITIRLLLVFNAVYNFYIIYASRDFESELKEDLSIYYSVYEQLLKNNYDSIFTFGNGYEIGWTLLYYLVSKLGLNIEPIDISLINTAISIILFFIWLEVYILRNPIFQNNAQIISAFTIMFLGIVTFGYLQRQSLSIVFLLFALTSKKFTNILFFTILSSMFHLTSIFLIVLYKILLNIKIKKVTLILFLPILIIIFVMLRLYFYEIVILLSQSNISLVISEKLDYYRDIRFGISSIKTLIFNLFLFILILLRWENIKTDWKNIILFSSLSYLMFAGIPLVGERINFILFYLYGFFLYISLFNNQLNLINIRIFKYLGVLYLIAYCIGKLILLDTNIGCYWCRFSVGNIFPMYYLGIEK